MSDARDVTTKNKVGRPPKFQKSDLELVQEVRSKGFSAVAFCAARGIAKSTYYEWKKTYPEFDYATQVAEVMSEAFWQDRYVTAALTNDKEFQLKVHDSLYEKQFGTTKANEGKTEINIAQMNVVQTLSQEELEAKIKQKLESLNMLKEINVKPTEVEDDYED